MNTTMKGLLLGALVSTSLGVAAMPALADPGDRGKGRQMAHFDGDRGEWMRGGPHGHGRGGPQGMAGFQGGFGGGRHGGPMPGRQSGGPMGGPGGPAAEMVIERFDVNGDGLVTKDEVTAATAEKVGTFDVNGDGSLSLEEYKALWTDAMNERIVRSFQFHDPDGDARVTLDEYSGSFDRMFAHLDRNGDGTIGTDEFGPPRGGDRPDGPPRMGFGGPGDGPGGPGIDNDD